MTDVGSTEALIKRVRNIIVHEKKNLAAIIEDLHNTHNVCDIVLAYRAAAILLKDVGIEVED